MMAHAVAFSDDMLPPVWVVPNKYKSHSVDVSFLMEKTVFCLLCSLIGPNLISLSHFFSHLLWPMYILPYYLFVLSSVFLWTSVAFFSSPVMRNPGEPPSGQGEMEHSGGPHSDSGSISPTWERDRRGPPQGPPGPLGHPGVWSQAKKKGVGKPPRLYRHNWELTIARNLIKLSIS